MKKQKPIKVSIVAPVFNEESIIEDFIKRILITIPNGTSGENENTLFEKQYVFEIILVDDGSEDNSLEIMKNMVLEEKRLRIIELCRNYGQTLALQAGLDAAHGEIIITMDSDLQHFPEEIPLFLKKLEEGYDMVCGWRHQRVEGIIRRWPSKAANYFIRLISGLAIHDFGTTYRAYHSKMAKELKLFGDFHRYIPALGKDAGGKITEIPIKNIERQTGNSSYGIGRTFGVLLDLIVLLFLVRYLKRPMRAFGKVGILLFSTGVFILFILFVYAYIHNIYTVQEHIGWLLMAAILITTSVQVILGGLLAEIMTRIHYSQKNQQKYNIRQKWNFANLGD